MKVDPDVDTRTVFLPQGSKAFGDFVHKLLPFDVLERCARGAGANLHGCHAGLFADMTVDTDTITSGAAQQLVDRHAVAFAGDIPQGLIDAGRDGRLDRTAPIEGSAMNRLPVMHDRSRVLADEIVCDFERTSGAGLCIVLQHLPPTGDACVRRDLDEDPRVLEDERFDLRDLDRLVRADDGCIGLFAREYAKTEAGRRAIEYVTECSTTVILDWGHRVTPERVRWPRGVQREYSLSSPESPGKEISRKEPRYTPPAI